MSRVYVHAFRATSKTPKPTLARLFEAIANREPLEETYNGQNRLIACREQDASGWVRGVVLTTKPNRSNLKKVQRGGSTVFTLEHMDDGTTNQGLNPFVVHVPTRLGLVASYVGSCSFRAFARYLKHLYRVRKREDREQFASRDQGDFVRGELEVAMVGDKKTFQEMYGRFSQLRGLEFSWEGEEAGVKGGPRDFLAPYSDRRVERWTLGKGTPAAQLLDALWGFMKDEGPTDVVAEGLDYGGEEFKMRLTDAEQAAAITTWDSSVLWNEIHSNFTLAELLEMRAHETLIELYNTNSAIQAAMFTGGHP